MNHVIVCWSYAIFVPLLIVEWEVLQVGEVSVGFALIVCFLTAGFMMFAYFMKARFDTRLLEQV